MFKCAVCSKLAKTVCSNCKNVFYCGKEHQVADWSTHKPSCILQKEQQKSTIVSPAQSKSQSPQSQPGLFKSPTFIRHEASIFQKEDNQLAKAGMKADPIRAFSKGLAQLFSQVLTEDDQHSPTRVAKIHEKQRQQKELKMRHRSNLINRRNLKISAVEKYVQRNYVDLYVTLEKLILACKEVYQYEVSELNRYELIVAYLFYAKILYPKRPEACRSSLKNAVDLLPPPMDVCDNVFPPWQKQQIMQNGAPYFTGVKNDYFSKAVNQTSLYYMALFVARKIESTQRLNHVAQMLLKHTMQVYGSSSCQLSNVAYSLGSLYYDMGNFDQARQYIMDCMQRRELLSSTGLNNESIYACILGLALCEREAGQLDKALVYFSEAERLARKLFPEDSITLAQLLEQTAKCDVLMRKFRKGFNYATMSHLIYKQNSMSEKAENCLALCTFIYRVADHQLQIIKKQLQIKEDAQLSQQLKVLSELIEVIEFESGNNKELKRLISLQRKDEGKDKRRKIDKSNEYTIDFININQEFLSLLSATKTRLLTEFLEKVKLFTSKISLKNVITTSRFYKSLNAKEKDYFEQLNPDHFA